MSDDTIPLKDHGIFSCEGFFDCSHSLLVVLLTAASVVLFIRAYLIISKDHAKKLDRLDYILFTLALVQVMVVFLTKAAYNSPFWTFTIYTLSLVQNIIVCSTCAYYCYEEEHYLYIDRLTYAAVIFAGIIWVFSWDTSTSLESACQRLNNIIFSSLNLAISLLTLWLAYHSIKFINAWNQNVYRVSEGTEIEMQHINLERIKRQVSVLMISMLVSASLEFLWEFYKLVSGRRLDSCFTIYHPESFMGFLSLLIHDISYKLLPSWAIYYIYYWRDRKSFELPTNETELPLRG